MNDTTFTLLRLVGQIVILTVLNAELIDVPRDVITSIYSTVTLRCRSSLTDESVMWTYIRHGSTTERTVYQGQPGVVVVHFQQRGFSVDKGPDGEEQNLVISQVTFDDAGVYRCIDAGGLGRVSGHFATASVTVFDSTMNCSNNINDDGVIISEFDSREDNVTDSCELFDESDQLYLSCELNFNGPTVPRLRWKLHNADVSMSLDDVTKQKISNAANVNGISSEVDITAAQYMIGSKFTCNIIDTSTDNAATRSDKSYDIDHHNDMKRSSPSHDIAWISWTSPVIKPIRCIRSRPVQIRTCIPLHLTCSFTSSLTCTMNWFKDGMNDLAARNGPVLNLDGSDIINSTGTYRCIAECDVRGVRRIVFSDIVDVNCTTAVENSMQASVAGISDVAECERGRPTCTVVVVLSIVVTSVLSVVITLTVIIVIKWPHCKPEVPVAVTDHGAQMSLMSVYYDAPNNVGDEFEHPGNRLNLEVDAEVNEQVAFLQRSNQSTGPTQDVNHSGSDYLANRESRLDLNNINAENINMKAGILNKNRSEDATATEVNAVYRNAAASSTKPETKYSKDETSSGRTTAQRSVKFDESNFKSDNTSNKPEIPVAVTDLGAERSLMSVYYDAPSNVGDEFEHPGDRPNLEVDAEVKEQEITFLQHSKQSAGPTQDVNHSGPDYLANRETQRDLNNINAENINMTTGLLNENRSEDATATEVNAVYRNAAASSAKPETRYSKDETSSSRTTARRSVKFNELNLKSDNTSNKPPKPVAVIDRGAEMSLMSVYYDAPSNVGDEFEHPGDRPNLEADAEVSRTPNDDGSENFFFLTNRE